MDCKEAQRASSAYLDGDLGHSESSAIRGHLRQCEGCSQRFEEESELVRLASGLESLEPPSRVWDRIAEQIAEEEIADSRVPLWRRWAAARTWPLATGGVLCAAAVLALVWRSQGTPMSAQDPSALDSQEAPTVVLSGTIPAKPSTVLETQAQEVSEADASYRSTIQELRAMLEEDRKAWPSDVARAVDAKLARFDREAAKARIAAVGPSSVGPTSGVSASVGRDAVYASYRAEIRFLQEALAGELPAAEVAQ